MADAPPAGLYGPHDPRVAIVDPVGATVEVAASTPGLAGTSAVALPDGEVWEVDHADPDRLVSIEVPAAGADASPLLIAGFGGDGALEVLDGAVEAGTRAEAEAVGLLTERAGRRHRLADPIRTLEAARTGRLVLLADMAADAALGPLGRVLALAELLVLLDPTPAGDLLRPVVARLVGDVAGLADEAEIPPDRPLDPERADAIVAALDALAAIVPDPDPVRDLAARIAAAVADPHDGREFLSALEVSSTIAPPPAAVPAAPAPSGLPTAARGRRAAGDAVRADGAPRLEARWVAEAVAEVVVPHGASGGWVRLLRPDDLVAVAQAPLVRHELRARAELLVEPGTDLAALEVQVIRPGAGVAPRGDRERVARAIRAGRAAASAERRGDVPLAAERWSECASEWAAAGDKGRYVVAQERRHLGTGGGPGLAARLGPLLVDEFDPYAAVTSGV